MIVWLLPEMCWLLLNYLFIATTTATNVGVVGKLSSVGWRGVIVPGPGEVSTSIVFNPLLGGRRGAGQSVHRGDPPLRRYRRVVCNQNIYKVCSKSLIYIVTYYIKWVKTSWIDKSPIFRFRHGTFKYIVTTLIKAFNPFQTHR